MPFGGLLTVGILGAAGSIFGGIEGSNAASKAAGQQVAAENNALDFQKQIWSQDQSNISPYLNLGTQSIGQLMQALQSGAQMPNAPSFTAPTLAQAEQTPGYQFAQTQGSKGILQGAAAAGGAISGGTLKSLDQFNSGLATTTYGNVFNQSLQGYQANLSEYQANLQRQGQMFNELYAPVQLGANAAAGLNNQGQAVASNVGNIMSQIGNAQAAGTVGSTNALLSGINGATTGLSQSVILGSLLNRGTSPTAAPPGSGPGSGTGGLSGWETLGGPG